MQVGLENIGRKRAQPRLPLVIPVKTNISSWSMVAMTKISFSVPHLLCLLISCCLCSSARTFFLSQTSKTSSKHISLAKFGPVAYLWDFWGFWNWLLRLSVQQHAMYCSLIPSRTQHSVSVYIGLSLRRTLRGVAEAYSWKAVIRFSWYATVYSTNLSSHWFSFVWLAYSENKVTSTLFITTAITTIVFATWILTLKKFISGMHHSLHCHCLHW